MSEELVKLRSWALNEAEECGSIANEYLIQEDYEDAARYEGMAQAYSDCALHADNVDLL